MRNDDLIKKPLYKTKNTCFNYLQYKIKSYQILWLLQYLKIFTTSKDVFTSFVFHVRKCMSDQFTKDERLSFLERFSIVLILRLACIYRWQKFNIESVLPVL